MHEALSVVHQTSKSFFPASWGNNHHNSEHYFRYDIRKRLVAMNFLKLLSRRIIYWRTRNEKARKVYDKYRIEEAEDYLNLKMGL